MVVTKYRLLLWRYGHGNQYLELEAQSATEALSMIPNEYSIDRCVPFGKWDTYEWDGFERTTLDAIK